MKMHHSRSSLIIFVYLCLNVFVIWTALFQESQEVVNNKEPGILAPEYTVIEDLDYFHMREGVPQMSLAAEKMRSIGEAIAEFVTPKGVYNYQEENQTLRYQAIEGIYRKAQNSLFLDGNVKVTSDEADYSADRVKYYFKKDLIVGSGNVQFHGRDLKTKDKIYIESETMRANPQNQITRFKGKVDGYIQRKKKYEGKMTFSSQQLLLEGIKSLAHLEGDVRLDRQSYHITAGKADIYLDNFNKSLKYFVLNDDVKMTEKLEKPADGVTHRKAYAERLEGFGREQKMVLSGAPRVEQGEDVIKGYRITIRENVDLIEVDDAMSDVKVKHNKEKKPELKE